MRKLVSIIVLAFIAYELFMVFYQIPFGVDKMNVAKFYLQKSPEDLKVANTVTAIVVNFRGFDTLGEVTVLFLASTGLGSILFRRREVHTRLSHLRTSVEASSIVQVAGRFLFPFIVLLGAYVFIHGHLTPGGGFQGGVIIATGFLFLLLAYRQFTISHNIVTWVESLAGITFAGIGLVGILVGKTFLENFLPTGKLNDLISGGIIPLIYIAVGFKVAAELTGILDTVLSISIDVPESENQTKNNE